MLKVFVINLATSSARRERVSARLNELGVEFELFEAVDGRKEPHPLFARYDDDLRVRYRRNALSNGELGCFSSHFLMWQHCVALNQPLIVMEDDVVISPEFIEARSIADKQIERLHFIRLAGTGVHRRPFITLATIGQFDLVDYIRGPTGALCYAIHPSAAKAFIKHGNTWYMAVDDYMDRYWCHHIDCYALLPYTVTVGDNESDIARLPKTKRSLGATITHELFGRLERLRMAFYRVFRKVNGSRHI